MTPDPRDCADVRELMSDYTDGELGADGRRQVEGHVGFCPACRQVLANLRHTLARLGALAEATPPDADDPDAVRERLRHTWRDRA